MIGLSVRFVWGLITWAVEFLASAGLWVLGVVIVAILSAFKLWKDDIPSEYFTDGRKRRQWRPRWAWLWGNDEDGIEGIASWWMAKTSGWSERRRAFTWAALRNPIGNLRFVKPFGFHIDPAKVGYVGNTQDPDADYEKDPRTYWYFAWCGLYSGVWVIVPDYDLTAREKCFTQIRLGWKIIPKDKDGLDPDDYRVAGCGTALQLQKK